MKNCPNCNQQVEVIHINCPKCGFQLMTLEQSGVLLEAVKEYSNFLRASLDISPQGIQAANIYIENVAAELKLAMSAMSEFTKKHKELVNNPNLGQDNKWVMDVKMFLMMFFAIMNGMENSEFSQKIIANPPSGCGGIEFELMKIRFGTEDLGKSYSNFLDGKDSDGLEKTKKCVVEISTRIVNAANEMEKVNDQIKLYV